MIKKIAFSVFSLLLIQSITASEADQAKLDAQMVLAIRHNDIDNIIDLLETSADVNMIAPMGATALSLLCDDAISKESFICNSKDAINSFNERIKQAETDGPLCYKIETYNCLKTIALNSITESKRQHHQNLNTIDLLLCKGANPNTVLLYTSNPSPEKTLPFLCAHIGHNIINKLDINIQDADGNTPLHKAVEFNNRKPYYSRKPIAICLIELGADISIQNKDKKTPIDLSTDKKFTEESARSIQMPFYKQNKRGNICTLIHQRSQGIKPRIGM